jgi:drug/metabolite transporter (DMT)-like permease
MRIFDLIRLLLLAAIWGASFLFIRIAVGSLGPAGLMAGRVALAAMFLACVGWWLGRQLSWRGRLRHFLLLGLLNSALPFFLFAYAARWLTASVLSVLNATAPLWGALLGALLFRQAVSLQMGLGLALGIVGVAVLVGFDPVLLKEGAVAAVAAAAGAACCYGLATHYTRRAVQVEPFANAHGSMWGALCWLLPLALFSPPPAVPGAVATSALLALGVICTGVAYLLYFGLVRDIGATPTLTVTFLIPVFGVSWGALFLNEAVGWHTLAGGLTVLCGTAMVTGFSPASLWQQMRTNKGPTQNS